VYARARHLQLAGFKRITRRERTILGRSAIAPRFSKMPSVIMKRRAMLHALILDGDEYVLEAPGIVVVVLEDGWVRDLEALLNRNADAAAGDNHLVALSERGDGRRDRREGLRVEDRGIVPRRSVGLRSSSRCTSGRMCARAP
jgi:hypothetical protein